MGIHVHFRDLRRWINQERGIYSSSNGDSDNANEYIKRHEQAHLQHHHYPQQRRRTTTYHGGALPANTRQPTILQKLFGVDHQTSSYSKWNFVTMMNTIILDNQMKSYQQC